MRIDSVCISLSIYLRVALLGLKDGHYKDFEDVAFVLDPTISV